MVCIAAFIVLILVGIFVAIISIFKKDFGRKYLKVLKKSFHCFGKKIRLQKCDTNFSDDVKTLLLKKVIIKKPKLVKPLSITIEIASVLLVIITAWSIIEAAKAGLSLWVFGTCNISQPSNCALGADSCGLDENNLNWFTEWGELFSNVPDRLKTWDANDYINGSDGLKVAFVTGSTDAVPEGESVKRVALSIIDPGCSVCLQSYKNLQKDEKFLKEHILFVVSYPIKNTDGSYRFANSELTTRYILALNHYASEQYKDANSSSSGAKDALWTRNFLYGYSEKIINRIFTEFNDDGIIYQEVFNNQLSSDDAAHLIHKWLREWGMKENDLNNVKELVHSEKITNELQQNEETINQKIKPKGIPTMIYNGGKHLGLFKA